jgi:hypothetical protein
MATSELFQFATITNLSTNPVERFRPQPILPDTPDTWLFIAANESGEIALPHLDATTGPLYKGKSVTLVAQSILAGRTVRINSWDAVGNTTLLTPFALGVADTGSSYTAIATWDEVTSTGFWQLIKD